MCKPLKFVNSHNRAVILIASAVTSGIVGSLPLLVFYGNKTLTLDLSNFKIKHDAEQLNVTGRQKSPTTAAPTGTAIYETMRWANISFLQDQSPSLKDEHAEYVVQVHTCHYNDKYDGSLSQVCFSLYSRTCYLRPTSKFSDHDLDVRILRSGTTLSFKTRGHLLAATRTNAI